ncbi:polysaccharide pyruvyl transferase family protein [Pseudoalteromonas sp. Angola-30]|uniref:polysaccharide pyruvyl transferase family protein n=1 Tax=Pseudoalteromonas sp. Angola-30 TaxID=3025341 RepID=UPI0023594FAC|nr:polysaccharide pyruvyl transferase family protein [Pseudoalteromonas sp. Angola-30]MDC9524635.1 polysaccharide pyruvyl transferase family protein [Pseudoalteromonas sp. Angola-30]
MTKNVVIVPACTDLNRGDQALVWETAYLMRDALGDDELSVDIVDYGNTEADRARQSAQTKAEGFNVIRNLTENPKRYVNNSSVHNKLSAFFISATVACLDFIKHFILLLCPTELIINLFYRGKGYKESFERIKRADAIVIKGGGYLHTYGKIEDLYYLWFGLYYVLLAKRLNKKVIIFPNSIGPITGGLNRAFFKYVIRKVDLLLVRERISKEYLSSMGISNAIYAYDLGYYSKSKPISDNKKNLDDNKAKKIGITLRPYRFPKSANPEEKYSSYIKAVADFCNNNIDGRKYYFIVQVQGPSAHETDLIAINDVLKILSDDVVYELVDDSYDYRELLDVYSKMDYVIGTRFHSVIFSQIMNIPSIAIAYGGNKSRGIMRELDLEEFVVDIEEVSCSKLTDMMRTLEASKEDYLGKLKSGMAIIEQDRNNLINLIRETF